MCTLTTTRRGPPCGRMWGSLAVVAVVCFVLWPPGVSAEQTPVPVIDLHVDMPYQVNYKQRPVARGRGRYLAEHLLKSGVRSVVLPLYVPRDASPEGPLMQHLLGSYSVMKRRLAKTPPYRATRCQAQPVEVHFAFEGAAPLGRSLRSVRGWFERGVSVYGLIHAYDNELGASSTERHRRSGDHGLTRRGQELVRRVHALGGIVDISHMSQMSASDVLEQAEAAGAPVVATHSNAHALARHHRNLTDAQLRRVARTGGVVGINFHSRYLLGGAGVATLSDVVRHIEHVVRVAGPEHVAIGSDFEGGIRPPKALGDVRGFPRLARALQEVGMSRANIRRVFHDNAARVLCRTGGRARNNVKLRAAP